MLVKNAENLMQAVIKTVKAAEAACIKVCPMFNACFANSIGKIIRMCPLLFH